jgi:hypothetical protein
MNRLIIYTLLILLTIPTFGQQHFNKFKKIENKKIPIRHGILESDSTKFSTIDLSSIVGFKNIAITLVQIKNTDSLNIFIYKSEKLFQKFTLPYTMWYLADYALVADINNDKKKDIKFFIYGSGNGLAAQLCTKIYLFNRSNKFTLVSFLDFAFEDEYDINNDGIYEIFSRNHVYFRDHSYWVYNAFNFKNNVLINISKSIKYPLWTKHLYKTDGKVATMITNEQKQPEYRTLPDEIIVK